MRTLRRVFVTLVWGGILVGQSQFVYAGPTIHFTVRLNNVTVPWLVPPPTGLSSFARRFLRALA